MKIHLHLLLLALQTPLIAAVLHDEAVDGDFSNNYLAPDAFVLSEGSNQISGELFGASIDVDLLTLEVQSGFQLAEIRVLAFDNRGLSSGGSFLGIQIGEQLSADPFLGNNFPDPIAFQIFGAAAASRNENILPFISAGAPLSTSEPLQEGNYAIWINETDFPSEYTLDFVVTAVPEPSFLLPFGLAALAIGRRRK